MPKFTGRSINLNFQEAFDDAVSQALRSKADTLHEPVMRVEVVCIYAERYEDQEATSFRNLLVDVEAT